MKILNGLKIIDFSRMLPGPLATEILAGLGAEVMKIESPLRMDYTRNSGLPMEGGSLLFHMLNHRKEKTVIDYNSDSGKAELIARLEEADIIIEQFRPGIMDLWGFGYKAVYEINPSVIYVSLTGYGQEGEFRDSAGHDINYLAYSGLLSLLKDESGKPVVPGFQLADVGGGSYMTVIGVLSAVIHRQNMTTVNYAVYECLDGKWLAVGALEVKFWNQLCETVNKPEWKRKHELELTIHAFDKKEVEALFKTQTRDEWITQFGTHSVCVAPILELEELENHPFHQSTNSFQEEKTTSGFNFTAFGFPFRQINE